MKKKLYCENNLFNREMTKYIEMLIDADDVHARLEDSARACSDTYCPSDELLRLSREMDGLVVKIMEKRNVIDGILDAENAFS